MEQIVRGLPQTRGARASSLTLVVEDLEGLAAHVSALAELSAATLDPNPFFEDWMLIPAIKYFKADVDLRFVFIFAKSPTQLEQERILCGFFPLVRRDRWQGLPVRVYSLWQHEYCFLCTPLVRDDYSKQCLSALFDWLVSSADGCLLLEFNEIKADGAFNLRLNDFLAERRIPHYIFNRFVRALYEPGTDVDAHLNNAVSSKYRSQLRRKRRRLAELGEIQFRWLQPDDDVEVWIKDFLKLEAKGWKGQEKTALDCNEDSRAFFVETVREAFRRGRLRMMELRLDGQLLAQRCSFISGSESFLFKLTYDEDFAKFSPGVLLELENMRHLNNQGSVEDSCAAPDHSVFNRLWLERREIQTTLASWSWSGAAAISTMKLYRWLKRRLPRGSR